LASPLVRRLPRATPGAAPMAEAPSHPPDQEGSEDEEDRLGALEIDPNDVVVLNVLGTGLTATVYRGQFGGSDVAVKVIDWHKSSIGRVAARAFERELQLLSRVDHPNIVKLIAAASRQKPLRLVMEYCSGGTLFDLLHYRDEVELSWRQRKQACLDVAEAMLCLHRFEPQIIHRDLKSLNLLLAAEVLRPTDPITVKVTDFGLSRMKEDNGWGQLTSMVGTTHWMAPEVMAAKDYDETVDVYSYAMIVFETVCREIPFEDEQPAEVHHLVQSGARPDMDAIPLECPPLLVRLMVSCWNAEPTRRPKFDDILKVLQSVEVPPE